MRFGSNIMNLKKKLLDKKIDRFDDNITCITDLFGTKKPSVLFYLILNKLSYLLNNEPEMVLSKKTMAIRSRLNPIIKIIGPMFLQYRQVIENKNELLGIEQLDKKLELSTKPVIWCPNHGFKDDALATVLVSRHAYILFGSLPVFYNTFDGITAFINGVVMCNRKNRKSRQATIDKCKYVIENGTDLIMYPEGVWNKTPEKLILELWPGIYRVAKETGCQIVPVIHYLSDPTKKFKGNVIHTVVAEPVSIEGLSEEDARRVLRDTMATWYFLMMEKYGKSTRKELLLEFDNADEVWNKHLSVLTGNVKYYDREIELNGDYRPEEVIDLKKVWHDIANIHNISMSNISMINYAKRIIQQEELRDFQRRW